MATLITFLMAAIPTSAVFGWVLSSPERTAKTTEFLNRIFE